MEYIIFFISGFVVVWGIWWLMKKVQNPNNSPPVINPEQIKKHKQNLGEIVGYMSIKGQMTNNDVENLLAVSNATAERYLNELEQTGKIVQVGTTGKSVFYKLK